MNYVSVHQSGEGQLSVNILADILADSGPRVGMQICQMKSIQITKDLKAGICQEV